MVVPAPSAGGGHTEVVGFDGGQGENRTAETRIFLKDGERCARGCTGISAFNTDAATVCAIAAWVSSSATGAHRKSARSTPDTAVAISFEGGASVPRAAVSNIPADPEFEVYG
jgi:hypothetical protein